jgi:hypothetical protein
MSHVSSGAVLTLVVPLSLLMVVLGAWGVTHWLKLRRWRVASRAGTQDT